MKMLLMIVVFLSTSIGFSIEKLPEDYLVHYGSSEAPIKIVQYYSLTCPHCVGLFRKEFHQIQREYIESGIVHWTFHPVPMDLQTVQAMDCFTRLEPKERKIFLEAILEELVINKPAFTAALMQRGMKVLEKPLPKLQEKDYLSVTPAFNDAFTFLKQNEELNAVPAIEINGEFIKGQVPNMAFLDRVLLELGGGS